MGRVCVARVSVMGLAHDPAVALLGARQMGKTTLAQAIAAQHPGALLLDMERESDRAAIAHHVLFFPRVRGQLVVLDDVQHAPQLFAALRPEIDADRRAGRFLRLGQALGGASHATAGRYLDTLVDTLTVRRLPPHLINIGKRLVKSPKIDVRDSGLLHALLGLASVRDLQGHPVAGASWEGFVIEQVAAALPAGAQMGFYRTAAGTELDVVVEHKGRKLGIEIKFSVAPKPLKGFWQALQDLDIRQAWVVAPVARCYPLAAHVVPVWDVASLLAEWADQAA